MKYRSDRAFLKKIAQERISVLDSLSVSSAISEPQLSKYYTTLMQRISSHYKVKMPKGGVPICKRCGTRMVPGVNAKVRLCSSGRYVAYSCNACGYEKHVHY